MKIKMLGYYIVEIKVKTIYDKRFSDRETKNFLNNLSLALNDTSRYCKENGDTYSERIATGISKAIYTELKKAGYYDEGR